MSKNIWIMFVGLFFLAACNGSAGDTSTGEAEDTVAQESAVEEESEWTVLFDGSSLDAWRTYLKEEADPKWQIEGETLVLTEGGGGDLITRDTFGDFELELDWKISEGGNSGIFYHIVESDTLKHTFLSAPEYQLLDNERHSDAAKKTHQAGANYDMQAVSEEAVHPAGEWNTTRIVVKDDHVEHWLNGIKVVEFEEGSEEWQEQLAASKFKDWGAYAVADSGHLGLQDHGDKVWFRNIRVKRL